MRGTKADPATLLCFPYAGAGAGFFRPWRGHDPEAVEVVPVQLPGREQRFTEPPYRDVHEAVDGLAGEVLDKLAGRSRVVVFGHSLGAILAYEMAHRLQDVGGPAVAHLVVSGSPGPGEVREKRATGLPDEEFLARVLEFAGYSHPALEDPTMRELLLPCLRADVEMHENYRPPASRPPLRAPITAVRGADDGLVSRAELQGWATATGAEFHVAEMPGGHMYLVDSVAEILALVGRLSHG
ncbi:thioesterase [Sphaerisporangium krabiense]|uniref:Surfactin synthase thioesterase subunit n=1 Tax=Sphaerisporangium krabiense TaxID=763782 RepID=A0A7W8Z2K6_9ACTN|nr:alpha/beta fold hydrolase [Sphaerisporangium krabiense]MBB5626023.1 surfactin synthase thioesterase subunit [Sphaerisporangium krabiense]GII64828.1 thioesterase [Sphaerisporangium krabiense]